MTKLSDTQSILLTTAAGRDTLSLYPLPSSLRAGGGLAKALAALVRQGLAEERETGDAGCVAREDGDLRFGLFATAAGLAVIGIEPAAGEGAGVPSPDATAPAPAPATKAALVVGLLQRPEGATLPELIAATGWLPHTTRAALTGLRKKGHTIEKAKRDGATCYKVAVK